MYWRTTVPSSSRSSSPWTLRGLRFLNMSGTAHAITWHRVPKDRTFTDSNVSLPSRKIVLMTLSTNSKGMPNGYKLSVITSISLILYLLRTLSCNRTQPLYFKFLAQCKPLLSLKFTPWACQACRYVLQCSFLNNWVNSTAMISPSNN